MIGGVVGEKIDQSEICNRETSVHTLHLIIVFCLVVAVFTAFLREWLSPDLVALSAMGVLLVSGVLTADETLSVFSNSAPIVISCMFVLSAGLERTGVIDSLARIFTRMAGTTEQRAALALAALTLPLSALINHMPVVVVFVPVVLVLARSTNLKASRLLIPLSYFSIFGGTITLIGTSTNLLVDGIVRRRGPHHLGCLRSHRWESFSRSLALDICSPFRATFCPNGKRSRLLSARG